MNTDNETQLPGELVKLLERQIESARHGDLAGLERLAGQCEPLVASITSAGLLDRPEYDGLRERLGSLYRELQLMLLTQKDAAGEQLKLVQKHRNKLVTYRGNI